LADVLIYLAALQPQECLTNLLTYLLTGTGQTDRRTDRSIA